MNFIEPGQHRWNDAGHEMDDGPPRRLVEWALLAVGVLLLLVGVALMSGAAR